jgi:glyoxylase-like metal-dependent hydrolase (beta-lactamase superfamily II)
VDVQKIAEGIFYLTGGSHHSVAVEFRDFVALIEAPQNDDRAVAVIETVGKTIPNKPIRHVVNTHHHFDHAGGLRAAVAAGLPIAMQAASKSYFERIWATPHTLNPDRLSRSPRKPVIEAVTDRRVITDGRQTLELHKLQGSQHADTMLIAYLPAAKLLVEADVYTPAPAGAPAGPPSREAANLVENLARLNLDVQQIAPLHGRLVTIADLRAAAGRVATN